ncbi:MAG: type I 3-dehydroquinate dehydratase [Verrucomicrobiota bacterium]
MPISEKSNPFLFPGAVVGTIHTPQALAAALELRPKAVDFLELRVDAFASFDLERLESEIGRLPAPLLVTVRHPKEGGANQLGLSQRRALFKRFLPHATLIDVELRSAGELSDILAEAREQRIATVLSHHDFRTTPSIKRLQALAQAASRTGCTVFKVATVASSPKALAVLMEFLASHRPVPRSRALPGMALAVMGMGEFGKISRLALGRAGSVLNYGYLDKPQVSGQWPAELLKQRLLELE